jgi:hypothetical protein
LLAADVVLSDAVGVAGGLPSAAAIRRLPTCCQLAARATDATSCREGAACPDRPRQVGSNSGHRDTRRITVLRRVTVLLVALLLALSVAVPAASAQDQDPTYVYWCFGDTSATVSRDDDIVLRCPWGAKTAGQLQMFLNHDVISFELKDGNGNVFWTLDAEDAATYWTEPVKLKASDFGFECKPDVQWLTRLLVPLGTLAAGTYTLTVNETYTNPVNDGIHTCSIEGERIPPPSLYPAGPLPTVVMTITVL